MKRHQLWPRINASYIIPLKLGNLFCINSFPKCTPSCKSVALRGRLEKRFAGLGIVIQALDVDRQEPWPYGQDRQEDQALSL